jgi:hypothetical protein
MIPSATKSAGLERVRYYPRQLMTAEDMSAEQDYFLQRMRRHNRLLHGWGIVCGLQVQAAASADKPWQVRICQGFALSADGDEIHVPAPVLFDLARPVGADGEEDDIPRPCPPGASRQVTTTKATTVYLAIRYHERLARPVRSGDSACGCGDHACENTRHRDDFSLTLLEQLPATYKSGTVVLHAVRSDTGAPVGRADVTISGRFLGVTDDTGALLLPVTYGTDYTLTVFRGDHQPLTAHVTFAIGESVTVRLERLAPTAVTNPGVTVFSRTVPLIPDCPKSEPDPWLILAGIEGDRTKAPPVPTGSDLNASLEARFTARQLRRLVPRVEELVTSR